jgi:hypothetical protein
MLLSSSKERIFVQSGRFGIDFGTDPWYDENTLAIPSD